MGYLEYLNNCIKEQHEKDEASAKKWCLEHFNRVCLECKEPCPYTSLKKEVQNKA
jgi:hypothetical protein